jgi:cobalt-zinc-cadmium efflux system membrane fusion protein
MNLVVKFVNALLARYHQAIQFFRAYPRFRKLMIWSFAVLLVVGGGYEGWLRWRLAKDAQDAHEAEVVHRSEEDLAKYGVGFAEAESGKLAVELKVPGEIKLNGDLVAHMVPRFSGVVRQVMKNLGDAVKKGEVLAIFENNANLAPFEMRSQIDGVIIEKNIALGEVIGTSEAAFVVADLSNVWVDLVVYPADLPRTKAGQKVRVIDQTAGRQAEGVLGYVAPTVSDHTRTALARVVLPNPDLLWRPGTFVTGAIVVDESAVPVMVDGVSIQDIGGVSKVFVKDDHGFVATTVRTGRRDDQHVEILDGVKVGACIATSGSFLLKSEITKGSAEEHEH